MARSPDWSAERRAFLREHYPQEGPRFCAEELETTTAAVNRTAAELGLQPPEIVKRNSTKAPWDAGIRVIGWGWTKPT